MMTQADFAATANFLMRFLSTECRFPARAPSARLSEEIAAFRKQLDGAGDAEVLSSSFGIVDQFVHDGADHLLLRAYRAFQEAASIGEARLEDDFGGRGRWEI